jgi:hypothetical protein
VSVLSSGQVVLMRSGSSGEKMASWAKRLQMRRRRWSRQRGPSRASWTV